MKTLKLVVADAKSSCFKVWEPVSYKVKCGTTLKILVPIEKIFLALRSSKLSRVVPPDIFGMVPGTIMSGTCT